MSLSRAPRCYPSAVKTPIAGRLLTSNLVFSQWDRIFKDPMTTAAAIDRVVHHSVILEMSGHSVRSEEAAKREQAETKNRKPEAEA